MEKLHKPVLLTESLDYLITDLSGTYFDATLGYGGHSEEILKRINKNGILVSTDMDLDAFNFSKEKFENEKRIKLHNFNFTQIDIISKIESIGLYDGILADLGVSSFQLDNAEKGFTYRKEAMLDLRMDKNKIVNASDVINSFSEEDLENIFFKFGEEKNSKKIAREICRYREKDKIKTTVELSSIVSRITPQRYLAKTLSRIFQALRIFVNDELNNLENFLKKSVDLLKKGGVIVVISYHSLEDRIVKEYFKYETLDCICPKDFPVCQCDKESRLKILTKKPVVPTPGEIEINNRARSAKLRAAVRI
ncbi:MAG: 16S rRNA (cytosine(1402)-N(4))-methyltransferase RsmH [Ignavibacteriaceae bacterium]